MEPENAQDRDLYMLEAKVACELLGLTYRRMDHYLRQGYILCDNPAPGSGMGPRLIPPREIKILRLMMKFIDVGFRPQPAALLARRMIFDDSLINTLPGGITITLTEETDSGPAEDDLDCSTEAQDLSEDSEEQWRGVKV